MGGDDDLITLLDEDGVEHEFNLVQVLEVDQRRYAVLQPLVEGAEAEAAVIFRMEDDTLITIEDDDEFERVRQVFEAEESEEEDAGAVEEDSPANAGEAPTDGRGEKAATDGRSETSH